MLYTKSILFFISCLLGCASQNFQKPQPKYLTEELPESIRTHTSAKTDMGKNDVPNLMRVENLVGRWKLLGLSFQGTFSLTSQDDDSFVNFCANGKAKFELNNEQTFHDEYQLYEGNPWQLQTRQNKIDGRQFLIKFENSNKKKLTLAETHPCPANKKCFQNSFERNRAHVFELINEEPVCD